MNANIITPEQARAMYAPPLIDLGQIMAEIEMCAPRWKQTTFTASLVPESVRHELADLGYKVEVMGAKLYVSW